MLLLPVKKTASTQSLYSQSAKVVDEHPTDTIFTLSWITISPQSVITMDERMDVDVDAAGNDDEGVDAAGSRAVAMAVEEEDDENHNDDDDDDDDGDEKEKGGGGGGVTRKEQGGGKAGLIKKFLENVGFEEDEIAGLTRKIIGYIDEGRLKNASQLEVLLWVPDGPDPDPAKIQSLYESLRSTVTVQDNVVDRPVTIGYKIKDSDLSHQYDLQLFTKKVIETDNNYYDDVGARGPNTYVAPYFCMIQSSGMGKTRLLYEYRNSTCSADDNTRCYEAKTILSGPIKLEAAEKGIFDWTFSVSLSASQEQEDMEILRKTNAESIYEFLDEMVNKELQWKNDDWSNTTRVLMFDEAHLLLENEYGIEAF